MQACSQDPESDVQGRAPFWTLIWETAEVPPPHGPLLSCQDHRNSHHWATFLWLKACFLKVAIKRQGALPGRDGAGCYSIAHRNQGPGV